MLSILLAICLLHLTLFPSFFFVGTTLNSEVTLPTIISKELVCRSSVFRDSIGQSCGDYEEAPNQMCVTEEARKSCCACGGGEITPENSETGEECQVRNFHTKIRLHQLHDLCTLYSSCLEIFSERNHFT
jgi:hypothetical protein